MTVLQQQFRPEKKLDTFSDGHFKMYPLLLFQFVLTEMYYDGFHRSFCDDDDDLDIIQESDSIFAFETPETFKLENIRTKRGQLNLISFLNILLFLIKSKEGNPLRLVCVFHRKSSGKPES